MTMAVEYIADDSQRRAYLRTRFNIAHGDGLCCNDPDPPESEVDKYLDGVVREVAVYLADHVCDRLDDTDERVELWAFSDNDAPPNDWWIAWRFRESGAMCSNWGPIFCPYCGIKLVPESQ